MSAHLKAREECELVQRVRVHRFKSGSSDENLQSHLQSESGH